MPRAKQLYERMRDYRSKVIGPNGAYARKAVQNFRWTAMQPLPFPAENFVEGMLGEMQRIYPERVAYVGREALVSLLDEGMLAARKHVLRTVRGAATCCLLMFQLGHGCFDDFLYPWLSRTLGEMPGTDPAQRAERLERKAVAYLEFMLKRLEQG